MGPCSHSFRDGARALIGLPYTVPNLPPLVGIFLFWTGVALLPVAAAIAAWESRPFRLVRLRFGLSGPDVTPMDEAIGYIWKDSRWACDHEADDKWFMTLQRDVRDALRLGQVSSYGRPALPSGEIPVGLAGAMQAIPPEHWRDHHPEIFDGLMGNRTANFSRPAGGSTRAFYDIHFDTAQMRKRWPRMSMIERRHHVRLTLR